jgi:hypothetical protein
MRRLALIPVPLVGLHTHVYWCAVRTCRRVHRWRDLTNTFLCLAIQARRGKTTTKTPAIRFADP